MNPANVNSYILNNKELLEFFAIDETFGVFRISKAKDEDISPSVTPTPLSSRLGEGFARLSDLHDLCLKDSRAYGSVLFCQGEVKPYFAPKSFKEDLMAKGISILSQSDYNPAAITPFTALENGTFTEDDLYFVHKHQGLVTTPDNEVVPMALFADLPEMPRNFGRFNLETVQELLKVNPAIKILKSSNLDGKNPNFSFEFRPSAELMEKIRHLHDKAYPDNPYRVINWIRHAIEFDVLGLVRHGALEIYSH